MLATIESVNSVVNNFIWGVPAMICIIGVGLVLKCQNRISPDPKVPLCDEDHAGTNVEERRRLLTEP